MKTHNNQDRILKIIGHNLWSIVLALIIFIAGFFRIWQITQIPAGFNADEAAIGYNAYSILKTGKDEFGQFLPVVFTSFGDFKPPLYFYLTVPFIAILGLTELAVRLPSAIFGVLTVLFVYFLTKKLFKSEILSLASCFFLAISPWHIHYSRGGWETNLFTFLLTLGVYLFIKSLEKPKFLYLSSIVFALSFYSYQGARLIMPLLVILLALFFRNQLFKIKKQLILSAILGLLIILPALYTFFAGPGFSRFSGVSIFADSGPFWQINERRGQHQDPGSPFVQILHNKVQAYGLTAVKNYFSHFEGSFLFITGDVIPRNRILENGTLLIIFLPFLLFGSFFLIIKKPANWQVIFLWLLAAPTASALTFQSPQALRAASMVVPLAIIAGYGFFCAWKLLFPYKQIVFLFIILTLSFLIHDFFRFWHFYTIHNPQKIPVAFEYGFSELVAKVNSIKDKYNKVLVTDGYDQPYILFLFYSNYQPEKFQKEAKLTPRDKFGFSTVRSFDKFEFRKINWEEDKNLKNTLIVGISEEIPENVKIADQVLNPDGSVAFKIVGTQ